jgi:4-carboxymuconolactone decarboxylase
VDRDRQGGEHQAEQLIPEIPMHRFPVPADDARRAAYLAAKDVIVARRGRLPEPHTVLLHAPPVALAFERLSEALRQGSLPAWALEVAHLVAARRMSCRYQWRNHAAKALAAGLSASCVERIRRGLLPNETPKVGACCAFATSVMTGLPVSDEAFEAVSRQFGLRGAAEFAAQCGFALLVASTLNVRHALGDEEEGGGLV